MQAEQMRALSVIDELTQLNNRRGFLSLAEQQLRAAKRSSPPVALLFMDLDGLKPINDQLGHDAGDATLKTAAQAMRTVFRDVDIIARLGGDEFVALLVDCNDIDQPVRRLNAEADRLNSKSKHPFFLSLSTGVAVLDPTSPETLDELMQRADAAMYRNKMARGAQRSA